MFVLSVMLVVECVLLLVVCVFRHVSVGCWYLVCSQLQF